MSYTLWGISLLFIMLFLFASGENILCSDPNNGSCSCCKFELKSVTTFSPRRHGFIQLMYPRNEVLDLSNHALTRLILEKRSDPGHEVTIRYSNLNESGAMFTSTNLTHRIVVPFIDLNGITALILSNNNVTVEVLMVILHDQRAEEGGAKQAVKYLDLSYLNISWLPGHIFEKLTSLKVLRLNNNPIIDIFNVEIALIFLRYPLKELDLSECGLRFLPSIFQDFDLSILDLSNNLFTTVPVLDYVSGSLMKLRVDGNPLSVIDDTSFSAYYNIEEISAENCSIHTITGQAFSQNYRLSKLNLQNNNIRYLLPDDIPLEQTEVSLWDNPWDCTCRNLWLMKKTYNQFPKLLNPYRLRCSTPAKYTYRPLHEAARELEKFDNCGSTLNLLQRHPPPSPDSSSFMSKKAMTNVFIIAGILAVISIVIAVVLIRKFYNKPRQQIYKRLQNILQHKDPGYLDEKSIQHM